MPATSTTPNPLEVGCLRRRDCEIRSITASVLIGQIKLTRIHVPSLFLPRGAGSNGTERHLFTMSKDPPMAARGLQSSANFVSLLSHAHVPLGTGDLQLNQIEGNGGA